MALTKWYLHNVAAPQSPSSGKKSTALPNGTLQNNDFVLIYNKSSSDKRSNTHILIKNYNGHQSNISIRNDKSTKTIYNTKILKHRAIQKYIDIVIKELKYKNNSYPLVIKIHEMIDFNKKIDVIDHEKLINMIEDIQLVEILG